jgi:hypothetical protein
MHVLYALKNVYQGLFYITKSSSLHYLMCIHTDITEIKSLCLAKKEWVTILNRYVVKNVYASPMYALC